MIWQTIPGNLKALVLPVDHFQLQDVLPLCESGVGTVSGEGKCNVIYGNACDLIDT